MPIHRNHPALEIDWSAERRTSVPLSARSETDDVPSEVTEEQPVTVTASDVPRPADTAPTASLPPSIDPTPPSPSLATFWDFARAVNRSDPAALRLAANGADGDISMDGRELRKLLGTFWFRTVFTRLSREWQDRMLKVLIDSTSVADHAIGMGRRTVRLREMTPDERQRMMSDPGLPEAVRSDLQFVDAVARHWGEDVLKRLTFGAAAPSTIETSKLGALLQPFRHG